MAEKSKCLLVWCPSLIAAGRCYERKLMGIIVLISISVTVTAPAARLQLFKRPVAIQNARILTMSGPTIEKGTLLIKGKKIVALGSSVELPFLAKSIDAQGSTITPGVIDVYSALGQTGAGHGVAKATRRAEDAFDHYDTANLMEALRQGVTSVYLSPGASAGICGTGAVLRLSPATGGEGALGQVLKSEVALCIDLGSASKPIARLKTLEAVRTQFRDALEHRQLLEDYEEELSEYKKKLTERARTGEKGKEPVKEKKTAASHTAAEADEPEDEDKKKEEEKKLTKPTRPGRKPTLDVLLKALDREMPVRIVAHRSEDILNALQLAEEFSFKLILEGATEAHLVAKEIADAEVLVVVGAVARSSVRRDDIFRRGTRDIGVLLSDAGVCWIPGSGAENGASARFVTLNAQMAFAGIRKSEPMRAVTAGAAHALGVANRIGSLRPGLLADFVLWSGDQLDPQTKVMQVYVGGRTLGHFAAGRPQRGYGDAFVARIAATGQLLWKRQFGTRGWDKTFHMAHFQDGSGDLLAGGCQYPTGRYCQAFCRRYSPEGDLECSHLYENCNGRFSDHVNSFQITYPSNCRVVTFKNGDTRLQFERVAAE